MMHMPEFPAVINVSNRFSLYGKSTFVTPTEF